MLVSGIKSRPVYKGLRADQDARRNIICAAASGADAVAEMADASPAFFARSEILYTALEAAGKGMEGKLKALKPDVFWQAPTIETLLVRLDGLLANAVMGTRLYLAGTEGFIGEGMRVALAHGIDHQMIMTEHRGSERRRVQCVHCKGITEDVTTNPATCSHCGLTLLVRDHYSRRIGAFQGVCINAEMPGEAPAPKQAFQ
jgi:dimethylamine monooxygenase subunit C